MMELSPGPSLIDTIRENEAFISVWGVHCYAELWKGKCKRLMNDAMNNDTACGPPLAELRQERANTVSHLPLTTCVKLWAGCDPNVWSIHLSRYVLLQRLTEKRTEGGVDLPGILLVVMFFHTYTRPCTRIRSISGP